MSKVKMTVTKLLALRETRDKHRTNFNKADEKLRKVCTHPKSRMVTNGTYYTDTLGNNGRTEYHDKCSICTKWFESYHGQPNYPMEDKKYG